LLNLPCLHRFEISLHIMHRNNIRLLIVLASVCIIGISITQVYWVKKAFDLKENQFNANVSLGLKNVTDSVLNYYHKPLSTDAVDQLSSNYFVVDLKEAVEPEVLERYVRKEFMKRGLLLNFGLLLYDGKELISSKCISFTNKPVEMDLLSGHPQEDESDYYFAVFFPSKDSTILSQMGIWIFSSFVLLIVSLFFAYTLFVILKQKRLAEIQKDFVNNMTHEFQTPISTISISAEVLKNPEIIKTPQRLLNYATIISTEVSRLKTQVERILQMSELENNEIQLDKESIDVIEIIKNETAKIILAAAIPESAIQLDLNPDTICIQADKLHFSNIIYNLLDNAVKYSSANPEIKISVRNERNGIVISVSDNGIGISDEHKKRIFDKFYRVPHGNTYDAKGFGLGLNYVKLLLKAHKGLIDVESETGKGSRFILFFPEK